VTTDRADIVRLAFEQAFVKNGWTVVRAKYDLDDQEWDYTLTKSLRRIKIEGVRCSLGWARSAASCFRQRACNGQAAQ
jgi:hypothetical protein